MLVPSQPTQASPPAHQQQRDTPVDVYPPFTLEPPFYLDPFGWFVHVPGRCCFVFFWSSDRSASFVVAPLCDTQWEAAAIVAPVEAGRAAGRPVT